MTKKEAIKVLRTESVEIGGNAVSVARWLMALDIAVKALAAACKERDEMKKELHTMRNELCFKCGNYEQAHNGAYDGCRWKKEA